MANLTGFKTDTDVELILDHCSRHWGDPRQELHRYRNSEIDKDRTRLNYALRECPREHGSAVDEVNFRISEAGVKQVRAGQNKLSSIIVTMPREGVEWPEETRRKFFESSCDWLEEKCGGGKNVIGAWVHLDETTPHMHFLFVPLMRTPVMEADKSRPKRYTKADERKNPKHKAGEIKRDYRKSKKGTIIYEQREVIENGEIVYKATLSQAKMWNKDRLKKLHPALEAHLCDALGMERVGVVLDDGDPDKVLSKHDQRTYREVKRAREKTAAEQAEADRRLEETEREAGERQRESIGIMLAAQERARDAEGRREKAEAERRDAAAKAGAIVAEAGEKVRGLARELEGKRDEIKSEVAALDGRIAELEGKVEWLHHSAADAERARDEAIAEKERLGDKVEWLHSELDKAAGEVEAKRAEVETAKSALDEQLSEKKAQVTSEMDAADKQLADKRTEVAERKAALDAELAKATGRAEGEVSRLEEKVAGKRSEAKAAVAELDRQVAAKRAEVAEKKDALDGEIAEKRSRLESLQQACVRAERALKEAVARLVALIAAKRAKARAAGAAAQAAPVVAPELPAWMLMEAPERAYEHERKEFGYGKGPVRDRDVRDAWEGLDAGGR